MKISQTATGLMSEVKGRLADTRGFFSIIHLWRNVQKRAVPLSVPSSQSENSLQTVCEPDQPATRSYKLPQNSERGFLKKYFIYQSALTSGVRGDLLRTALTKARLQTTDYIYSRKYWVTVISTSVVMCNNDRCNSFSIGRIY